MVVETSAQGQQRHAALGLQFSRLATKRIKIDKMGWLGRMVIDHRFDYAVMVVVILNSLVVGAQAHYMALNDSPSPNSGPVLFFEYFEFTCTVVFTLELFLRLWAVITTRFCDSMWKPLLFDAVLVMISWVDIYVSLLELTSSTSNYSTSQLKMLRMSRALRLLRLVRFLADVRMMIMMIMNSLSSLFWLFWLLVVMLFCTATLITQGTTDFVRRNPETVLADTARQYYGSLWMSMYTLFKGMSGGVSWGEAAEPLLEISYLLFAIFLMYIFFTLFSVLNIVTGVFVDSAIQAAQQDRHVLVENKRNIKKKTTEHLLSILEEIDVDRTGVLDRQELEQAMGHDHVKSYFAALEIDTSDISQLVDLLDNDSDGTIDISEFVEGLLRLKGEAKSFDVHMMMMQNRQVLQVCKDFMELAGHRGR